MWENTIKALDETGKFMIQSYRERLAQSDPYSSNATYNLFTNVNYSLSIDTTALKLLFNAPKDEVDPKTGKVWIEQGRLPGKYPPIQVIERWVIKRGIQDKYGGTQKDAAYKIQRHIFKNGIRPKPYLSQIREEILIGAQLENIKSGIVKDFKAMLKIK